MLPRDTFESPAAGTLLASPASRASTPAGDGLSISLLLIFYNFDVLVAVLAAQEYPTRRQTGFVCSRLVFEEQLKLNQSVS